MFRWSEAGAESLRGGPGCVPLAEPAAAEVLAGDPAAAQTHHGLHTTAPRHLPLLRHVTTRLPREISSHLTSTPGR